MDASLAAARARVATLCRPARVSLVAVTIAGAFGLAACGSSGSGDAGSAAGGSTGASGIKLDAQKVLDDGFKGVVQPPPTSGPRAQKGKNVWLLTCLAFEGCQRTTNGMIDAAKVLGWNLKVIDTKADPNLTISAMRQAISAGADAIVELPMDCPVLKSGLLAAKAANVPVIAYAGLDCDNPVFKGGKSLFAANVSFNGKDWADFYGNMGERNARFVLALAKKKGIETPKIIQIRNDDQALQAESSGRFEAEIRRDCPRCTIYPLRFTIPQLGAGKGTQIFKSGLLAHPDANILYYHFDSQLPAGLQPAIQSAGHRFDVVCCGDGGQSGLAILRSGLLTASNAYPFDWAGWAVMDGVNRVLAGEKRIPYEGGQVLYVDAQHNLPAPKQYANGSFDYKGAYAKVWGGS